MVIRNVEGGEGDGVSTANEWHSGDVSLYLGDAPPTASRSAPGGARTGPATASDDMGGVVNDG